MNVASLRSAEAQNTSAECKLAKVALVTISLWFMAWTPYLVRPQFTTLLNRQCQELTLLINVILLMVMLGHQLHRYLSIGTNFTTCYYLGITLRQSERSLQPNHLRNQPSKISSSLVQELPMSFMRFERQQEHGRQPISCFRRYRRLRRKSINSLL